jgi:hypothetical protein
MGSEQTIKPENGLVKIPLDYPTDPTPGKLEMLLQTNAKSIYHRYSPYVDYDNGFDDLIPSFGVKEPLLYNYIDEGKKGISGLRKYETRLAPIGSAPRDIIRVSKFLGSGRGLIFLGKQFLLQSTNKFNETRVYNPTSPIIASGTSLTFGLIRPKRNLDLGGGLGGLVRSLIGDSLPDLFGKPVVTQPFGTVVGALPDNNPSGGKGLLRAGTAKKASAILEGRWPSSGNGSNGQKTTGFFKKIAESIFGDFIPKSQNGIVARSDEGAYGLMIGGSKGFKFEYVGQDGGERKFGQIWIAGGSTMRKTAQYTTTPYKLLATPNGTWEDRDAMGSFTSNIPGVGSVGYPIGHKISDSKPGVRYGDSVGVVHSDEYEASDVMMAYEPYTQVANQYPSKKTDQKSIEKANENLEKVLKSLRNSGIYQVSPATGNNVIRIPNPTFLRGPTHDGYDRLFRVTSKDKDKNTNTNDQNVSPINYLYGTLAAYRDKNVSMVDNSISNDIIHKSKKLPGAGNFDAINTLRILSGDKSAKPRDIIDDGRQLGTLNTWRTWEPYKDDQIAFFFQDVVNDKYIPFRATVKGISEAATANWEELSFIGRADKLFSYSGFSRTLSFGFDVVVGSILELAPTWKRINYLMSLVKPSGYTTSKNTSNDPYNELFNRFMIPPMVMITIGDMYKSQPVIINSITLSIPEDSAWETLNEENSKEWSYLVDYIKSSDVGKEFGQFPRQAQFQVNCTLLEKERAIVGAANFGHAPHSENYKKNDINQYPAMHRALVEYQKTTGADMETPTNYDFANGGDSYISTDAPEIQIKDMSNDPSRNNVRTF